MKSIPSKRGFALALVLWISAALMAVALYSIVSTKESVDNAKKLLAKLQSRLDAESAFEKSIFYLSSGKYWEDSVKNEVKGMPKKIVLVNKEVFFKEGESNITLRVQDIGGLENITIMGRKLPVIRRLIKNVTGKSSPFAVDSYLDWLDMDEEAHLNGAESFYYKSIVSRKYGSSNRRYIQHPDELRLIRGFDILSDSEWREIKKYLAYSYSGGKNILAFPKKMIESYIKVTPSQWKELMSLKRKSLKKYRDKFFDYIINEEEKERLNFHPTRSFVISLEAKRGEALSKIWAMVDVKPKVSEMINIIEYK